MNIFSLTKRLSTAVNDHSGEAGPRGLRLAGAANANAASAGASANESKYSSKPEQAEGVLKMAEVIEGENDVMCCRYSPDGTQVAVGYQDGNVKIYNAESCELMNILTSEEIARDKYPVMCVRFIAPKSDQDKHMLVATYTTGHVRFWNYPEQTCVNIVDEMRPGKQTFAVAINSSGDSFATVGSDNQIYVYGTFSMRRVRTLQHSGDMKTMTGHVDRVYAIHFHPQNPNIFLTGGWDNTVHFWDARNRSSFRRIFGPHICGDALELDITGNNIVTGSWRKEKTLQIWDFGTGDLIKNVPDDYGGGSALYCAQWLGKEYVCCGGCNRNRTRVCDRKNYATVGLLGDLPQGVYCLDNDRSGRGPPQLCVGAARKVYLLKIQTQSQQ